MFIRFSCWWTLLISSPVVTLFIIFQILNILQYFLNKRIDSLKDLTWSLYDTKNEKTMEKLEKKVEKMKKKLNNAKRSNSTRVSMRDIFSKPKTKDDKKKIDQNSSMDLGTDIQEVTETSSDILDNSTTEDKKNQHN